MNSKQTYLVSVIIPNYCHSIFLDQRIQSVLNQTYQNFELIILDDCSPDNGASRSVIEKYRRNEHVTHIVYNEENSGSTFKQWDLGISLAKGDLIWIAESDDYCKPELLEILVKEFERDDNLTLAYAYSYLVDTEGRNISIKKLLLPRITRIDGKRYVNKYMTLCNHCSNASAALFKKNLVSSINPCYKKYKAAGDYRFWIEIALQGNVSIIHRRLNYFRQHNNKVTPQKTKMGVNSIETHDTYKYLMDKNILNDKTMRLFLLKRKYQMHVNKFASDEVRERVQKVWGFHKPITLFDRLYIKILDIARNRFDYFFEFN